VHFSSIDRKVISIDCKVASIAWHFCPMQARVGSTDGQAASIARRVVSIEARFASLESAFASTVAALTPLTRDQSQSHKTPDDFPEGFATATRRIPSRVRELDEVGQMRGRACRFSGSGGAIVTRPPPGLGQTATSNPVRTGNQPVDGLPV
jgi:hypothetical protein